MNLEEDELLEALLEEDELFDAIRGWVAYAVSKLSYGEFRSMLAMHRSFSTQFNVLALGCGVGV